MTGCRVVSSVIFIFMLSCGLARAQTPLSLAIHGPETVNEALNSEYRAVVSWSDGTRSSVPAAWSAAWSSANAAALFITPFGSGSTLTTGNVAGGSTVNISATYFGPTGSISASKSVTVLDASSFPSVAHVLVTGWNLLGNSIGAPLNAVLTFGDPLQPVAGITSVVLSVWKWDGVNGKWAFFSPTMTPTQLASYAAGKNYSVLQVVHPGEGYWVNVSRPVAIPARSGGSISLATNSIVTGWNLLGTGQQLMPSALNAFLSVSTPPPGTIPQNFVSLWGWDADSARWLFYSPGLEASGGLPAVKAYTDANGYLDFPTLNRPLGHGVGFWVHSSTANANSNLAPLGQAKTMFSELRTTIRGYTNDLKTGFLDAQSTRIRNDLQFKVTPVLPWVITELELLGRAVRMYENVKNGVTSSYQQAPGSTGSPAGTVRAERTFYHGSVEIRCFSNDMTAPVSSVQLLNATCRSRDTNFGAWDVSFPNRTQLSPFVRVSSTGTTSSDYNYQAFKQTRLEQWNGTSNSWQFVSNTQVGATQPGTLSRTYLPDTTNVSTVSLTGKLPSKDLDADHDAVSLTLARAVQNAAAGVYRYSVTGLVTSKTAAGASMVTLSLASGSYYDAKEDSSGNPLPNSAQAVHVVGTAETSASRFTGTLDLNAFARDADNAEYVPASSVFEGLIEDLSAGGAGVFLTGRLTVTLNNVASYHSLQPQSAGNFLLFDTAFVGTIQAPSRPEMRLTAGSSRTGLDAYTINTNYTYGPVSVTGTGTLDTFNMANSSLTLTNQNGITVTFQPHADAVVRKGGTTLGIIPLGSSIVYYIDGYFESL